LSDLETFGAKDAFIQAGMVAMFAIPAVLGAALMIVGRRGETGASR
jgi:hypothetical protein